MSIPFISSCGKDDPATCNWSTELQAEATAVNNAGTAYGLDGSTANCLAYKASLQAYLNASEGIKACANAAGQGVEFQAYLDSFQANINLLPC